jgi:hypothetical protein
MLRQVFPGLMQRSTVQGSPSEQSEFFLQSAA